MRQKGKGFFLSRTVCVLDQAAYVMRRERKERSGGQSRVMIRLMTRCDENERVLRRKQNGDVTGSRPLLSSLTFSAPLTGFCERFTVQINTEMKRGVWEALSLSLRACFMLRFESNSWRRLEILLTSNDSSENTDQRPAVKLNSDTHTHTDESDTVMVNEQMRGS